MGSFARGRRFGPSTPRSQDPIQDASTNARPPGGRQPVNRQLLADYVYQEVIASLMDGLFEPGQGISIDRLAREFEVSQTPIREALARLEATGLVRREALKGYRVASLFTAEELGELMAARARIEPAIAELACAHVTAEFRAELQRAVEDLRSAPTGPTPISACA